MFIFRFIYRVIKGIVILVGLGTIIWWGVQYFKADSPLRQKVDKIRQSGILQEGVKDIKTWGGEVVKGVRGGSAVELTDEERKKLEDILGKEMVDKDQKTKK